MLISPNPYGEDYIIQIFHQDQFLITAPIFQFLKGMPIVDVCDLEIHPSNRFKSKPAWANDKPIAMIKIRLKNVKIDVFTKFLELFIVRMKRVDKENIDLGKLFVQSWRDCQIFNEIAE